MTWIRPTVSVQACQFPPTVFVLTILLSLTFVRVDYCLWLYICVCKEYYANNLSLWYAYEKIISSAWHGL